MLSVIPSDRILLAQKLTVIKSGLCISDTNIIIINMIINITNNDECHAIEPSADVRQDP